MIYGPVKEIDRWRLERRRDFREWVEKSARSKEFRERVDDGYATSSDLTKNIEPGLYSVSI